MIKKFKNIISLLMVLALLAPSLVKLDHHHEHFVCNAKNEKHFHDYHGKCAVCSFEYSIFLTEKIFIASEKVELIACYNSCLNVFHYSDLSKYSFSLRAPPEFTNSI